MSLHESGENYLETILLLQRRNGFVRAVDVANELGYTKASISHCVITQFLMQTLHLDMDAADADACRIEHVVSEETFERIREYVKREARLL